MSSTMIIWPVCTASKHGPTRVWTWSSSRRRASSLDDNHPLQVALRVVQQEPGLLDIEQLEARAHQLVQNLDDVVVVDQRVRQGHEPLGEAGLSTQHAFGCHKVLLRKATTALHDRVRQFVHAESLGNGGAPHAQQRLVDRYPELHRHHPCRLVDTQRVKLFHSAGDLLGWVDQGQGHGVGGDPEALHQLLRAQVSALVPVEAESPDAGRAEEKREREGGMDSEFDSLFGGQNLYHGQFFFYF